MREWRWHDYLWEFTCGTVLRWTFLAGLVSTAITYAVLLGVLSADTTVSAAAALGVFLVFVFLASFLTYQEARRKQEPTIEIEVKPSDVSVELKLRHYDNDYLQINLRFEAWFRNHAEDAQLDDVYATWEGGGIVRRKRLHRLPLLVVMRDHRIVWQRQREGGTTLQLPLPARKASPVWEFTVGDTWRFPRSEQIPARSWLTLHVAFVGAASISVPVARYGAVPKARRGEFDSLRESTPSVPPTWRNPALPWVPIPPAPESRE